MMPNMGIILKDEIARLARKELRAQTEGLKKASAQYRRDITSLKKQVALLEKKISSFNSSAPSPRVKVTDKPRFSAKGLRSQRERLGLSAKDCAKMIGVSAQTVYNWERKVSFPRKEQIITIASLRGLGKKEARARLAR
jgi:DNA-binding transcriptional regulator YiaG